MRFTLNFTHHSQPFGGWSFPVQDSVLKADTGKALVEDLKAYRDRNGIPEGDPEHDIAMHYAKTHPWLVKENPDQEPRFKFDRVFSFVGGTWRMPPYRHAPLREHERRMAKCAGCEHRVELGERDPELRRRIAILTPGCATPYVCKHHGFICNIAADMLDPKAFATKNEPEHCWTSKPPEFTEEA